MINDNELNYNERIDLLGMEFIKQKDGNYLIKNANGRIVSEKEKLQLENKEMVLEDITSDKCVKKITKKISKNKKRIKEIDNGVLKETDSTME